MRPRRVKFRAPWRWGWGRILGLILRCGAWALALEWSPFFGIPLAAWIYMQLRAGYSEPLPQGDGHEPGDEYLRVRAVGDRVALTPYHRPEDGPVDHY